MARPIQENLTERPQENLTEQPLLEGTGEKEFCAPLKGPPRTRRDGEFYGPYNARIEDFFDLERSEINEDASDASIRVPVISKKYYFLAINFDNFWCSIWGEGAGRGGGLLGRWGVGWESG